MVDNNYVVQIFHWFGEGTTIFTYVFNNTPTKQNVQKAHMLMELKLNFKTRKYKEVFKCWECGNTAHWLDVRGEFADKINALEDKYCGC